MNRFQKSAVCICCLSGLLALIILPIVFLPTKSPPHCKSVKDCTDIPSHSECVGALGCAPHPCDHYDGQSFCSDECFADETAGQCEEIKSESSCNAYMNCDWRCKRVLNDEGNEVTPTNSECHPRALFFWICYFVLIFGPCFLGILGGFVLDVLYPACMGALQGCCGLVCGLVGWCRRQRAASPAKKTHQSTSEQQAMPDNIELSSTAEGTCSSA